MATIRVEYKTLLNFITDVFLANLRDCPRVEGETRVYFAGLKEFEKTEEVMKIGVPLSEESRQVLCKSAKDLELTAPFH